MFFGVDYYPEQWDISLIDSDLFRMKEAGINCIRIAEFAWHLMEPKEGKFDFSFFYNILDKAQNYNIKVMLGTPTATLPAWMVKKYSRVLSKDENLRPRAFGGRRQACLNSKIFQEKSNIITEKMAKAYKDHPAVLNWHVDNELGHETSDLCYCKNCQKAFRKYLKKEFKSIDKFNDAIGSVFWSQTYNNFKEINIPLPTIPAPNPGMIYYFNKFRANTTTKYLNSQVKVLRKIIPKEQLITNNFTGDYFSKAQDHVDMAETIDFVSLNNYPVWGGLSTPVPHYKTAMKLDQTRGFKNGQNFWITEQLIGAQAHTTMGYVPRPNQAKLWSFQALARGCSDIIYFRWRTAIKGAEQFCYGVLDHDNQINHRYKELKNIISIANKHKNIFAEKIKSNVALLYSMENIYSWRIQPQSNELDIQHEHARLYKSFFDKNISVDVIDSRFDFSNYKVILLPIAHLINDNIINKLKDFIINGGTVIASFRAGNKNIHNEMRFNQKNPIFELAGIEVPYFEALNDGTVVEAESNNHKIKCSVWRDMLKCTNSNPLYKYSENIFQDFAAVSHREIEKGDIYYIGSGVDSDCFWENIVDKCVIKHNLESFNSPEGVEIVIREDTNNKIVIIMNHNDISVEYINKTLNPYDVIILEFDEFKKIYN